MADLPELEHRLKAALARIGAGIDQWRKPGTVPNAEQAAQIAHLELQLDQERAAHSQTAAALRALEGSDTPAQISRLERQVEELDLENQRLLAAIAGLRQDLRLMDEQAEAHLAQANRATEALQADLDALIQAREAETAEIAKILAALAPMIDAEKAHPHAGS